VYPVSDDDSVGRFVKEQLDTVQAAGVDVRLMHVDRTRQGRGVYRGLGPQIARAIAEHEPTIVHAMYGGVTAGIIVREIGETRFVVSFCGNDLLGEGETKLSRRLVERYAIACSRRAARRADHVIVKSQPLRDALPPDVPEDRISLLPNGVDLTRFAPSDPAAARAELGWSDARRHVLFPAGTTRPEKRYWLARAAVDVLNASADEEVELHVLFDVPPRAVPTWLNASDALILTSTHEGSPNAVKEALASNVPVVSTDVGDVSERISGVTGCVVADPTPEALAEGLRRAFAAGRVNGREAVRMLALDRVAERLKAIYETTAASDRRH
jgi:glycosyltransferase involved in cell wall biosynthesis